MVRLNFSEKAVLCHLIINHVTDAALTVSLPVE